MTWICPVLMAQSFAAPQINLPKGGGAIRGIDEKFTSNPVTFQERPGVEEISFHPPDPPQMIVKTCGLSVKFAI